MSACLSSFWLKLIAVVAMVIDHVGMLLFSDSMLFRVIGRMSFPIFCFLIVEGFYHTSDVKKYMARLAIFAVLSEVPFNLLVSGNITDIRYQNVYFTLLIGLVTIYFINSTCNYMLKSIILVAGAVTATILFTDYSFYGVILIYVFYNLREKRVLACLIMGCMSFLVSTIQGAAILSTIPILLYNGKKGPKCTSGKWWKYAFYSFYPIHLMVLYVIACGIG